MTLGQVVPNFTGQVVSSKILRIFRWTLWVTLYSEFGYHFSCNSMCRDNLPRLRGKLVASVMTDCRRVGESRIYSKRAKKSPFARFVPQSGITGWPSLIKWSLTTIVSRLKEIRCCLNVARDSLKTLAYQSLPKYWMQKMQKSWNRMCYN